MEKPRQRKQHKATEARTGNQSPASQKVKAPTKHQTPKSLAVLQGLLRTQIVLTQKELAQFDGTDQKKPIYIAIKGEIFDVSRGSAYYTKGGAYGFFSGKDASRAYTTGCFQTHLTHDLRGLSPQQLEEVDAWADFYRNHPKYFKVGTVILDPIDPNSPIPVDCKQPVAPKPASS
ncbi:hypothetical protein BGX34_010737 [Mortierella sp. NVP85]|nr:hypothetical protein BGX34_010737 [Mortierella sp. NVP85]